MNFNIRLSTAQTLALTAAMLAVAQVDGVQPAELKLIEEFYEGGREGDMPTFVTVLDSHQKAQTLLEALAFEPDFAGALVSMGLMVGYSDGKLSDAEQDVLRGLAYAYGFSVEQFDEELQQVRDSLLGSLAFLPDAESVAALAKEL